MEVSVFTKKQIRSSLSMKKTKSKQVIKSVLASPYNNTFWPELDNQTELRSILEKHLPCVKALKVKIPFNEIKAVPKEKRKEFRQKFAQKVGIEVPKSPENKNLILGINDVTKNLESNSLSFVLISKDVQPKLMVQHVIDLAILRKIPVLIVEGLRKLIQSKCGISSVTFGVKNDASSNSLLKINKCVQKLFKHITPPTNNIYHENNCFKSDKFESEDMEVAEVDKVSDLCDNLTEKQMKELYYLKVSNGGQRAFVPERNIDSQKSDIIPIEFSDFDAVSKQKCDTKMNKKYKSLKVKRLKSDAARLKKKIKNIKKFTAK